MVVQHLTGEKSALALVGCACAGKSTTVEATLLALEDAGYTVIGGYLAGVAAKSLRTESGLTGRTIASLEYQRSKDSLLPDDKTIFVMDETGMVSSAKMERVDYKNVVQSFAKHRGYSTTETIVKFVRSYIAHLRENFYRVATAFDKLRKSAPEPPSISPSINRQTRNLGHVKD